MPEITSISRRILEEEVRKRQDKLDLLEHYVRPYAQAIVQVNSVYLHFKFREKELLPIKDKVMAMLSTTFSGQELPNLKQIGIIEWCDDKIALLKQEISGFNKDLGVY